MFKNKKLKRILFPTLLGFAVLTGCQSADEGKDEVKKEEKAVQKTQELSVGITEIYSGFDPHETMKTTNIFVANDLFEGLTRIGEDGKIVPGIAEKWEVSEDGTTYTFHLREAKWSDGSKVTAQDFVYGWKKAMSEENDHPYKFLYNIVEGASEHMTEGADFEKVGIKAVDEKTVVVTLTGPAVHFLDLTAYGLFFPAKQEFVESNQDSYGETPETTLYNGPFVLDAVNEKEIVLKKNEKYWDNETVKLEKVTMKLLVDDSNTVSEYEGGNIDVSTIISTLLEAYDGSDEVKYADQFGTSYISINLSDEFLSNDNIRQAISLGIDRSYTKDSIFKPAEGFVSHGIKGYKKTFREEQGNLIIDDKELAKEKLALGLEELGLTEAPTIEFVVDNFEQEIKAGERFIEDLNEVGFNVKTVVTEDSNDWYERLTSGNYQLLLSGWGADYNDPTSFLNLFLTESSFEGYSNATYDRLVKEALTTVDLKERTEKLLEAERILIEDAPIVPISHSAKAVLIRPSIEGLVTPAFGPIYEFKWVEVK